MDWKKHGAQVLVYFLVVSFFLGATHFGSRAVTVISQEIPVERTGTIVIDPGHGGEDGGAVSCSGAPESGINLQIALRLNDLFHLLGYRTRMIRTTDVSVYTSGTTLAQKKVSDLKERVRIIGETENPVLVSIHQNTFADSSCSGAQVFYNSADGSKRLAEQMQEAFRTLHPFSSRSSKPADGVYLMEHVRCTAVLAECGFLSNPREEAMLNTAQYQQKICCVIVSTVSNFLDGQTND